FRRFAVEAYSRHAPSRTRGARGPIPSRFHHRRRDTDMLLARAPMRISLAGGGTDLEAYYGPYGGLVISTAINKYFYAILSTDDSDDLQVISADYRSLFRHSAYNDLFWNGDLA